MKERHDHIQEFINLSRELYGEVPRFVHTTKDGMNYSGPTFGDEELIAVIDSVLFGSWLSAGEKVSNFEKQFSDMFHHGFSLMVNSGSSANLVMISALKKYYGWNDGDEIILSVVGFPTTLSPLLVNNLKPVFVDIEFDSLNFDIDQIKSKITDRTRGIFVSPVLGNPPDFDRLGEYGIRLILDNCDSLGSSWDGKYLSEYCVASSCSFYPAHHITTGEGGMVSSDINEVINIARGISAWGRDCTCVGVDNLLPYGSCHNRFRKWIPEQDIVLDHKYVFSNIGYNLKPLDLQGAIGVEQLKRFSSIIGLRRLYKKIISETVLALLPELKTTYELPKANTSWFGVPFICPDKEYKVKLVAHLEKNRVQTRNYFAGNILLHKAYKHLGNWRDYPEANKVLERVFFLGCSPNYTKDTINYLSDVIHKFNR